MKQLIRFLLSTLRENPFPALLACVTGAAAVLSSAGLFGLSAYLIAFTALHPSFDAVMVPVVGVRFFGIARAVFRYLERLVSHDATFKVLRDLRISIYKRMEPYLPDVRPEAGRGGIVSRMISDVENLQEAFLRILYPYMVAAAILLCGFFLFWAFSPLMAFTFGVIFALAIFLVPYALRNAAKGAWEEAVKVREKMYGTFIEFSYGIPEILANGRERSWEAKLGGILERDLEAAKRAAAHGAAASALSAMFPGLSLWACLAISCWMAARGMLPGEWIAVAPLVSSALFEAALPIFTVGGRIEKSAASSARIFAPPPRVWKTAAEADGPEAAGSIRGNEIRIENLSFGYSKEKPILKGFNLTLRRGQAIALTGASGIGKSTIANLLLGFAEGYTGTLQIDGVDVKSIEKEKLRSLFSVVDQKPFFFNSSLRDNLKLANPAAADETIFDALRQANMDGFTRGLPEGLDTVVAELGASLSGGELQRLAIARALLKDAPFFIFDEPTSGLDTVNEKEILGLILELAKSKGVLLITHRKAMTEQMDRIVRM